MTVVIVSPFGWGKRSPPALFPASTATCRRPRNHPSKPGSVKHAALGIVPTDITPQLAQRFSLPTTAGALEISVSQGSPAEQAGMKAGDISTPFARIKVGNVTDLLAGLRTQDPGRPVAVNVQRGTGQQTLHVPLVSLAGKP
ncbi:PDZ domain-containing protein [Arthrobacter sp. DNA4]|uniref:PDZ domain-containing protein n=1 Tax=Micrococcaceae TaxID=1268 RepID=UPI0020CC5240|nr:MULTISPECIES: PDZ domain-containing protein [Micrococcaceae]UTT68770.1 PDZ domain-containing protein [Arthrobacter sp. DNA4]WRT13017.1 PDZ domain-containing protein [Pseudarthrobacter sp. LT1]